MKFDNDFIERVRDANHIADVIGQYTTLSRSGGGFKGLCPFPDHKEKTPSFSVDDGKGLYHCFGCKRGGTVFTFFEQYQGMSFPEAVEYLAQRARIPIPENTKHEKPGAQDTKALMYKLNKYVAAYYHKSLVKKPDSHPVKQYLLKRGLSEAMVEEFKLGHAQPAWSDLVQVLTRAKAPLNVAEKLGLIKKRSQGDGYIDLFRDRLIFPIISVTGNVVGFGGRTLGEQMPKYLNSSESDIFRKSKTLYGLNLTARHIRAQDEAFVVEGYMDLIGLYQAGIQNVVATLGTALTPDHVRLLKRYCSRVVVLFDGDQAGQSAAEKSLSVFLAQGLNSRHLVLPDGLDPDEFVHERGVEEFRRLAVTALDHFVSFLNMALTNYRGQGSEKIQILEKIAPLLAEMVDQRLKSLYVREAADRLNVTEDWLVKSLRTTAQTSVNTHKNKGAEIGVSLRPGNQSESKNLFPKEEQALIKLMLKNRAYLEKILELKIIDEFTHPETQKVAREIGSRYLKNPNDFDRLGASLVEKGIEAELISSSIVEQLIDEAEEWQLIQDCSKRVRERRKKQKAREIINTLKVDDSLAQLEQFMNIAKDKE